MDRNEYTLLKEIKELYHKLKQNVYGEYRGGFKIGKPGFGYDSLANKLLNKVQELHNTIQVDYLDIYDIQQLMATINKEVAYVEYYYQKALKPNASKKCKEEVYCAINKANDQIKLDLSGLFKKIDEIEWE